MTEPTGGRVGSREACRGLTIAWMILVNNPGSWSYVYAPLAHAAWHGWTPTDLIFPYFLFIVGVAIPFSFSRRLAEGADRGRLFRRLLGEGPSRRPERREEKRCNQHFLHQLLHEHLASGVRRHDLHGWASPEFELRRRDAGVQLLGIAPLLHVRDHLLPFR